MRRAVGTLTTVMVAGLLLLVAACGPNSTPGVAIIGDNLAKVPAGQSFVLEEPGDDSSSYWTISYDGVNTVTFNCKDACQDLPDTTLGAVGQPIRVDAGFWTYLYVTRLPDNSVSVKWPWGWNYRPYQAA